jgi:hypothetical protein
MKGQDSQNMPNSAGMSSDQNTNGNYNSGSPANLKGQDSQGMTNNMNSSGTTNGMPQ